MKDLVYYVDKITFELKELGEIQTNFQCAFTLDGTNDSGKIIIFNHSEKAIDPNTIIFHKSLVNWYIVSHDQVDRYANEVGFLYTHTLTLDGCIGLLNARDLTDCGCNQAKYTIREVIQKLFKLSTFEFAHNENLEYNIVSPYLDLTKKVDYVKTFENYTLLTALREFLDGYNCACKGRFFYEVDSAKWGDNKEHVYDFQLEIVSKTGNSENVYDLNDNTIFKDVQEKRNIDKNSFTKTTTSNGENVISVSTKTYPSVGTKRLTGTSETITPTTARLRLPSNIFNVNWIKLCIELQLTATIVYYSGGQQQATSSTQIGYKHGDSFYNQQQWDNIRKSISSWSMNGISDVREYLNEIHDNVFNIMEKGSCITLHNCDRYSPTTHNWIAPDTPSDFYFPIIRKNYGTDPNTYYGKLVLTPKEIKDSSKWGAYCAIGWERGKDYIEDFSALSPITALDYTRLDGYQSTDLRDETYNSSYRFINNTIIKSDGYFEIKMYLRDLTAISSSIRISNTTFIINYTPMTDMKIKYDNSSIGIDNSLYNQNGRLTDSNALSKMLLSTNKEMEFENLTRYSSFYINGLYQIPQVGDIVYDNDKLYVINHMSMECSPNEQSAVNQINYFVDVEYTLSRNIATKSLLVNPNTNVRDYGIPQNYNVKRKQLYRDIYELTHESYVNNEQPYLRLGKVLNLGTYYRDYGEHTAVIKIEYASAFGGDSSSSVDPQDTWYYQLNSTVYMLKKSLYEIIDFKDNNIIGYSALNVSSAFDVAKLLTGLTNMANTPVSYVDDNGNFKSISLAMCDNEHLTQIYFNYQDYHSTSVGLYNSSVFIDSEIFEGVTSQFTGAKDECDFMIEEVDYDKDALEVPVFEYSLQMRDSDDIIIGEEILTTKSSDYGYIYYYVIVNKGSCDNNRLPNRLYPQKETDGASGIDVAKFTITNDELKIKLYERLDIDFNDPQNNAYSTEVQISSLSLTNKEIAIVRATIDPNTTLLPIFPPNNPRPPFDGNHYNARNDLIMVIKNLEDMVVEDNEIVLAINNYKSK